MIPLANKEGIIKEFREERMVHITVKRRVTYISILTLFGYSLYYHLFSSVGRSAEIILPQFFFFFVFVRYNSSLLSRPPIYRSYISRQYIVKFVNQLMYIWDRMLTSWITCIPSLVWHWYIYSTCYSLLFPSCRIGEAPRSCSTVSPPPFSLINLFFYIYLIQF